MPSPMVKEAGHSEIKTIPRDYSVPWSSVDRYSNNNGGHGAPHCEGDYPSLPCSEGTSVFTPALDNGDASTDVTSDTNPGTETASPGIGGQHGKASSKVPGAKPDLPWPTPDEELLSYSTELEIEDGDQGDNLRLGTCTEPAGSAPQATVVADRLDRRADVKYKCVTQSHGWDEVRIGNHGRIPRWSRGSELRYNIREETFPIPGLAALVSDAAAEGISMWQGHGVRFKEVGRDDPATFQIRYKRYPDNNDPRVYACAFPPREWASSLSVYELGLVNADFLANILAHEFGHILGLRHEFDDGDCSVRFGRENDESVMNYFDHASKHQVGEQDRKDLARFYAYDRPIYMGRRIVDIDPLLYIFPENDNEAPYEVRAPKN
ncbi:hypothetical protein V8C37DRAFT_378754 [Trichoderma ceciliae]